MSFWKMVFAVYLANLLTIVTFMVLGFLFLIALGKSFAEFVDSGRFDQTVHDSLEESRGRIERQVTETLRKPLEQFEANAQQSAQAAEADRRQRSEHNHLVQEAKKMCEYWAGEFRKDKSSKSEAYMDNACMRWRKLLSTGQ